MTKREFLKFCGTSFCLLSAPYLLGFPKASEAQTAKKGLIKTKLSPYFTSLEGGGDSMRTLSQTMSSFQREEGFLQSS